MPTRNICNCPHPPVGTVSCEPDQLAICRVRNGVAERECFDPPDGMDSTSNLSPAEAKRYLNWSLQHITGHHRYSWDPISPSDEAILRQGVYHNVTTGEEVGFRLPDELNLVSPSAASGSGPGGTAPSSATPSEASSGGATATY